MPAPTVAKTFRLLVKGGTITLRPLPFGQTTFTFTAEFVGIDHFDAGEGAPHQGMISAMKTGMISASMKKGLKTQLMIKSNSRANNVFSKILNQFCVRFQKDNVIDARRKADFIKNLIPNAPPLTEDEEEMIEESMKFVEDVTSRAKRIAGTVNESVEKFLYRDGDGGAAWGMTVARMDVAAITLFTEVSEATSDKWLQYLTQSSRSLRLPFPATLVADLAAGHLRQMGRAQKDYHQKSLGKY